MGLVHWGTRGWPTLPCMEWLTSTRIYQLSLLKWIQLGTSFENEAEQTPSPSLVSHLLRLSTHTSSWKVTPRQGYGGTEKRSRHQTKQGWPSANTKWWKFLVSCIKQSCLDWNSYCKLSKERTLLHACISANTRSCSWLGLQALQLK